MSLWRRIRNIFRRPQPVLTPRPQPKPQEPQKPSDPIKPVQPTDSIYEKVYETAFKEIGTSEVSGDGDNPRVVEYHKATSDGASPDSVPWCASFVSWVLEKNGIRSTRSKWARSYSTFGVKLDKPVKGCIVVLSRTSDPAKGHVGFYAYETPGLIWLLGGNQGDKVSIAPYDNGRLISYRGFKV